MRKWGVLIACGVGLVCGIAPYWFGLQTERTYHALVHQASATWPVPVRTLRYTRGWWSSTAETFVELPAHLAAAYSAYLPPAMRQTPGGLRMVHRLVHGPFALADLPAGRMSVIPVQAMIHTTVAPGTVPPAEAEPVGDTAPTLHVQTTIALSGGGESRLLLDPFTYALEAPHTATVAWQAAQGRVTFTAEGQHLLGTFSVPRLAVAGRSDTVALQQVTVHTDIQDNSSRSTQGDIVVEMAHLDVATHTPDRLPWALDGWRSHSAVALSNGTMDVTTNVQVAQLRLAEAQYGPGTATVAMRHVHVASLPVLQRLVTEMQQAGPQASRAMTRLFLFGNVLQRLTAFLRYSPEIELATLRLHTREGDISAQARVHADGGRLQGPGATFRLFNSIAAEATGAMPAALVHETTDTRGAQLLRSLVDGQYLIREGDQYTFKAHYTQGRLLVHGKPVALPVILP